MIVRAPGDEHPIVGIQMSATDVVEHRAGQPVAGHFATPCPQGDENVERRLESPTTQIPELTLGCGRQLDLDRFSPRLVARSSSSSSSVSGTSLPAARSAKPSSAPASADLSRRIRMTCARSCRSSWCRRMRSSARFTSASDRTLIRTGVAPATGSRMPVSIQALTVGCDRPSTLAASETFAPRSRSARWLRTASRDRRRRGSSSCAASSSSVSRSSTSSTSDMHARIHPQPSETVANPQVASIARDPVPPSWWRAPTPELQSGLVWAGQLQHMGGFLCSSRACQSALIRRRCARRIGRVDADLDLGYVGHGLLDQWMNVVPCQASVAAAERGDGDGGNTAERRTPTRSARPDSMSARRERARQ